jgi:hypothetical protein
MAKKDFGTAVGKCEVCTINLWDSCGSKPAIWPCSIKSCPYELTRNRNQKETLQLQSPTGSGLGQIDF